MSKLSFRARHLDPSKQMPIYLAEELPDLPEYSAINRAVPQMPSGMEKEEESEHHLQRAICTGLIIPTPEVYATEQTFYDTYYPADYKMPRQLIHMQPLGLDTDVPDYDMDSADEEWLSQQSERLDLTELKFEQMMDRLEKSSGQTVVTLNEAKMLLKQDDEISISVYDYWLNKRLKMQHPLILTVKTENRPGASSNNPYLAFRRRTEKMQTRKNRKNDETSYEKMLKLRRDLQRATTMLEMVKKREETKRDQLKLSVDIFEKRVQMRDFNGAVYSELCAQIKNSRPAFTPLYTNQYSHHSSSAASTPTGGMSGSLASVGGTLTPGMIASAAGASTSGGGNMYASASQYLNSSNLAIDAVNAGGGSSRKEKRQYKKRKHKLPRDKQQQQQQYLGGVSMVNSAAGTSPAHHLSHLHHLHRQSSSPAAIESNVETEEEDFTSGNGQNGNKPGSESEEEAPFAFRRQENCNYLRTRENNGSWPWETPYENNMSADRKYRYTLTSISHPRPRCIGFARRRVGRGGRVLLDRASTNFDDFWSQLDYTVLESVTVAKPVKKVPPKPCSPPTVVDLPTKLPDVSTTTTDTKIEHGQDANTVKADNNNEADLCEGDVDDDDDDNIDDDELDGVWSEDENISRIEAYSSALTLGRGTLEIRNKRRRLRLKKRREKEMNAAKRQKDDESSNIEYESLLKPLPAHLLRHLSNSMEHSGFQSILLSEQVKREKLSGNANTENIIDDVQIIETEQDKRANHQHHRSNNNTVLNNNNNSSSNINKNVSVSENFNVIKQEMVSLSSPSNETTTSTKSTADDVAKTIKQELIDADDSNEPLISIRKSATTPADIVEDEDNVNLAQLSNIIRHTVKREMVLEAENSARINSSLATSSTKLPVPKEASKDNSSNSQSDENDNSNLYNDDDDPDFNQVPDVIRLRNLRNSTNKHRSAAPPSSSMGLFIDANAENDEVDYMGSLSPTSSQRLDICNELLSEIRRDWLHFRPKTPTDELSDSYDSKLFDPEQPLVNWSEETPITLEMHRQETRISKEESPVLPNDVDTLFVSEPFKYAELEADTQLIQTAYSLDVTRGSSKSPDANNSNSGLDFNLSGESLNDINLLGDGDETDENMLDNILQECAMDDMKTLNQATNFWNGLLDGEAAVDEVVGNEVETADGLLDCIDSEKKTKSGTDGKRSTRGKSGGKSRFYNGPVGSSTFKVTSASESNQNKVSFFSKEDQIKRELTPELELREEIKEEPPEIISNNTQLDAATPTPLILSTIAATPQLLAIPNNTTQEIQQQQLQPQQQVQQPQQQQQQAQLLTTTGSQFVGGQLLLCTPTQDFQHLQQQQQQSQQKQPTSGQLITEIGTSATTSVQPAAAVGDIVTIAPHATNLLSRQTIVQPQLTTLTQQQQQQLLQMHQTHLRSLTVQQRQIQQQNQQIHQQQQQLQQQQLILQMQRDLSTSSSSSPSSVLTQFVSTTNSSVAGSTPVTVTSTLTTPGVRTQPTLTPISAGTAGNHTIYTTTTSGDIVAATSSSSGIIGGSTQKLAYTLQKSSGGGLITTSSAQMPSGLGSNTVITLSNVKLQGGAGINVGGDGGSNTQQVTNATNTNLLTIDSGGNTTLNAVTSSASGVNIINTSSGQQVALHNISGLQHVTSSAGGLTLSGVSSQQIATTSTPLIFTTASRSNSQQLTQPQLVQAAGVQGQPTQQFVWRQVGATNVAGTNTAVITATTETPTTMTNKILWTNRTPHKRQTNGPETTDINKLLLNRKFTQRKVVTQQIPQQQHQVQLTKQQLQQLQQQQQQLVKHDDDGTNSSTNNDHITLPETTTTDSLNQPQQQQQQQQPQLQKVQMGKVIKMSSFPLLVSDLNVQQQQQQQQQQQILHQQKQNSAAAIASNHNYSLQPTAIITSQAGSQQGNKIYLTSSNSSGTGNFTIATASELQAAAAAAASSGQTLTTTQKIHYKDLQNSNLKVNFISAPPGGNNGAGGGGNILQQDSLLSQQQQQQLPQTQQVGSTTVVLNKVPNTGNIQQQQQQQKLKTVTSVSGAVNAGDNKRVLYTSLLNVKPLQKNNSGQMQMQIGPGGLQHVLRGRLANNPAIFTTNVRTLPLGTTVNSTSGPSNQLSVAGSTTIRQLVSTTNNSNNNNSSGGNNALDNTNVVTVASTVPVPVTKEVNKGLTVEQIVTAANNGGISVTTGSVSGGGGSSGSGGSGVSNNNNNGNNNSNSNSSGNNAGNIVGNNATTSGTMHTATGTTTTTINR